MAIRRTRQERETSQVRRTEQLAYSFTAEQKMPVAATKVAKSSDLWQFDSSLVKKDLLRTVVASLVVFGILIGLYFKL